MPLASCIADQGGQAAVQIPAEPDGRPGLPARRPAPPLPGSGFRRRGLGWDGAGWSNSRPSRGRFPLPPPPRRGRPDDAAVEGGRATPVQESGQPGALERDGTPTTRCARRCPRAATPRPRQGGCELAQGRNLAIAGLRGGGGASSSPPARVSSGRRGDSAAVAASSGISGSFLFALNSGVFYE